MMMGFDVLSLSLVLELGYMDTHISIYPPLPNILSPLSGSEYIVFASWGGMMAWAGR